jgi:hypothetical protein
MTWSYPRGRYRWTLEPRGRPAKPKPVRRYIDTDEGRLAFNVKPLSWLQEGRRRGAYLNGHPISDDELELRLAALRRSA